MPCSNLCHTLKAPPVVWNRLHPGHAPEGPGSTSLRHYCSNKAHPWPHPFQPTKALALPLTAWLGLTGHWSSNPSYYPRPLCPQRFSSS